MYCLEACAEKNFSCKSEHPAVASIYQRSTRQALEQLQQAIKSTNESLDNCFVFTLENRNQLMNKIADLKEQANHFGCSYLLELITLSEIITMVLFRSNYYRDHQGLALIEEAAREMHVCCLTKSTADGQRKSIAETIERLWRWVDSNTIPGTQHL